MPGARADAARSRISVPPARSRTRRSPSISAQFVEAVPCATIDEVFRAAESGQTDYAVVPVENSTEGAVGRTLDLMCQTPLAICGEIQLRIRQNLLSNAGAIGAGHAGLLARAIAGAVRAAGSPRTCRPCRASPWRATPRPRASPRPSRAPPRSRARIAAAIYGLDVLAPHIEDEPNNTTRFWVLGRQAVPPSGHDETSLVMSAPNRPGAVYALLEPFAKHGVSHVAARIAARAHGAVGIPVLRRSRRPRDRRQRSRRRSPSLRKSSISQAVRIVSCSVFIRNGISPMLRSDTSTVDSPSHADICDPAVCARLRARHRAATSRASRSTSSRANSGSTSATSSSSRRTRIRAARAPRCAPRSPRRPTSCRRYPDGNGFALKAALVRRAFGVRRPDRARQRLERHPGARHAGVSAARRRTRSTRGTRSPSIRSRRRRAARTGIEVPASDFGPRSPGDARRDHAGDAHRVRRQSEQPDRHVDRAGDAARRSSRRCRPTCWSCSTRRTTNTSSRSSQRRSTRGSRKHPNLVVSRTFSKAYGLAALRVGYGIMHAKVADMLNRVRQPFNVNALAQAAAVAALADIELRRREPRAQPRGHARAGGGACGAEASRYVPSHANFLLVDVGDAGRVYQRLLRAGRDRAPGRQLRPARVAAGHGRAARRRTAGSSTRWRARARRLTQRAPMAPVTTARAARIGKLVVVGVGLIGGSFALALREAGRVGEVVGVGRSQANLDAAMALAVVDRAIAVEDDWTRELATRTSYCWPRRSRSSRRCSRRWPAALGPHTIVTDAGSTKQDVDRRGARARCARRVARASCRGIRSRAPSAPAPPRRSRRSFADRNVVLTPLSQKPIRWRSRPSRAVDGLRRARPRRSTPPCTIASSPRCRICRICSRSRSSTPSLRGPTPRTSSGSPAAASAISRASRRARPRCGATSRSPTATRCLPKSAAFRAQLDRIAALHWRRATARRSKRVFAQRARRARRMGFAAASRRVAVRRRRARSVTPRADAMQRATAAAAPGFLDLAPLRRAAARWRCRARRASPTGRCCSPRLRPATRRVRGLLDADDVDRMRTALARSASRIDATARIAGECIGARHRRRRFRSSDARRCSLATPARRFGR